MRVLAVVLGLALALAVQAAWAQGVVRTTLVDEIHILYPGGNVGACWELAPGYLRVSADSPPGRTGEIAYLSVRKTTAEGDVAMLRTLVGQGQDDPVYNAGDRNSVEARYTVLGGRYCYDVDVSKTMDDPLPPDRPERPNKQVRLLITHRTNP